MAKYNLPYYLENCGDGSAALRICQDLDEAKKLDKEQSEGWGEPSADEITIEVIDGVPYYNHRQWVMKKRMWVDNLVPLVEV